MQKNQVKIGAILSYVSIGLSIVISLVYTPVMIQRLGKSEYGVYNLVLPIISYLQLLSLGLGSAYVRYFSRAKVADDQEGMAKLNGMFLLTFSFLGAMILAIGFYLSFHGDVIFGNKLTAQEIALGERLLRIMSVNAAIHLPLSVFDSHITIHERYLFQKIIVMLKQVVNPLVMIPLLILGFRSTTLTVVALIFTCITGIANMYYCFFKLRMRFSFRKYDFGLMREMFGFTFYVFIGIVVDNFNWSIDQLLLGWLHGTTAVTIYMVASQLNTYYLTFGVTVSNVLTPRVHRLVASGAPMRELDALFTRVGRLQFILLGGVFLGFVAVGRSFVVLWAGGEEFAVDYYTTLLLFFANIWTNVQTLGLEIQRAKNMHKFRSLVYAGVAIANALISIPLCIRWQGLGAAMGTMVSVFVGNVLLMNWYYHKRIGLNIPQFWRHILHLLPAMLVPTAAAVLLSIYVHPTSYFGLILPGCAFVAVYALSMWLFGMNRYERELVLNPLRKITGRLGRGRR